MLRQRSIQMAQDERAIRLWADHLAFSMIHRGGVYIRTEVRWTMTRCKFTFDDGHVWNGFSHGSTWNGFDNVAVTKRKSWSRSSRNLSATAATPTRLTVFVQ